MSKESNIIDICKIDGSDFWFIYTVIKHNQIVGLLIFRAITSPTLFRCCFWVNFLIVLALFAKVNACFRLSCYRTEVKSHQIKLNCCLRTGFGSNQGIDAKPFSTSGVKQVVTESQSVWLQCQPGMSLL